MFYWHQSYHSNVTTSLLFLFAFAFLGTRIFKKSLKGPCTSLSYLKNDKVWTNSMKIVLEIFWNKDLWVIKTVSIHAIDIISLYLNQWRGQKMQFHFIAVWFQRRGGLLWPIARKGNLISLRSAAFFTIFVCNLVHAYKFHGNLKTVR